MNLTSSRFKELASLYGQIAVGKETKRNATLLRKLDEVQQLTNEINAAQDRIDKILPDGLSEADRTTLAQSFTLYSKNPATLSRKSIDKILPGFAAYAESLLPKQPSVPSAKPVAPVASTVVPATKPAAPQTILSSNNDEQEFGQKEANFIARSLKNTHPNINEIINRYRQALRNGGPNRGSNYSKDDTLFLLASPEKVTPQVRGISGAQQSITDDYIDFMFLALHQFDRLKSIKGTYLADFDYCSMKSQIRSTPQQFQDLCSKLFALIPTNPSEQQIAEVFERTLSRPTEEDLRELKAAVTQPRNISLRKDNNQALLPNTENDSVYGRFVYLPVRDTKRIIDFLNTIGDIEPGKKGGFLKPATPDSFLGVNQEKLKAYKAHLEEILPRLCQITANAEYESIFTLRKLIPDYLLLRDELGKDPSVLCYNFNDYGGTDVVSELLHHYGVSSAKEVEAALSKEIDQQQAYEKAVRTRWNETLEKDEAWNQHVKQVTDGKHILVREPLRDKYIRETTASERRQEAAQVAAISGIQPSRFLRPKR